MAKLTTAELREFLEPLQGKEISLADIRKELKLDPAGESWENIRNQMYYLEKQKEVKSSGKRNGIYKVLKKVEPVKVFGHNQPEPVDLIFPRDRETEMEFDFAEDVIVRSGDLILIAGVSNYGKTALAMNFLAENIDGYPVLLGNEFTTADGKPTPRFAHRLEQMDWVQWTNGTGEEKFTLLPVMDDFEEYIIKDKVNLVDWINIESGEHYQIGNILKGLKKAVGDGVVVAVIQKSEQSTSGRGGQFTKDFADLELLLDAHGESETRVTIGKCKESKKRLTGKSWAFSIENGTDIKNVRQVRKCGDCHGSGYYRGQPCGACMGIGWKDG